MPTPERFDPMQMGGELVEAEHMARYLWSTSFCRDMRVLDAGCGIGYGAAMLHGAGASEVVGVDVSETAIEIARSRVPDGVWLEVADLVDLPFPDDQFDRIVCFEVIEHVDHPELVLDELARVLAPGGLLLISSPNRDRYVPGNPHHKREFLPSELAEELRKRLGDVLMLRQHVMLASVLTSGHMDETFAETTVERMADPVPDDEIYALAVAGNAPVLAGLPLVTLTHYVELRRWVEMYAEQVEVLQQQAVALRELGVAREDRQRVLALLADREQMAAIDGDRIVRLSDEVAQLNEQASQLRARIESADRVLGQMRESVSWRVTAPLRRAKRVLSPLRGR
jgi:SAM-dependent methyltransferase